MPIRRPEKIRHTYRVYGLTLGSPRRIPELTSSAPPTGRPDVTVRFTSKTLRQPDLEWPGDSSLRVSARCIDVRPAPGADPLSVRLGIVGPGLSLLLAKRKLLVLHGSVIERDGQAVAFVGESGAGKSTLAAALCGRGWRLVSDNLCVLRKSGARYSVLSGPARSKLRTDSAKKLGRALKVLSPIEPLAEKSWCSLKGVKPKKSVHLSHIFILGVSERISSRDLPKRVAIKYLLRHSVGYHSSRYKSLWPNTLYQITKLVQQVELIRLQRTRNLRRLDALISHVERLLKNFTRPS